MTQTPETPKALTAEDEIPFNNPKVIAELAALPIEQLCDRLRGIYRIPVNDGAGPLNGSHEFVRKFYTGAIMHAAAEVIATQATALAEARNDALPPGCVPVCAECNQIPDIEGKCRSDYRWSNGSTLACPLRALKTPTPTGAT